MWIQWVGCGLKEGGGHLATEVKKKCKGIEEDNQTRVWHTWWGQEGTRQDKDMGADMWSFKQ